MKIVIASDKLTGKWAITTCWDSDLQAAIERVKLLVSRDAKIASPAFAPFHVVYDCAENLYEIFLDFAYQCAANDYELPKFGEEFYDTVDRTAEECAEHIRAYEESESEAV